VSLSLLVPHIIHRNRRSLLASAAHANSTDEHFARGITLPWATWETEVSGLARPHAFEAQDSGELNAFWAERTAIWRLMPRAGAISPALKPFVSAPCEDCREFVALATPFLAEGATRGERLMYVAGGPDPRLLDAPSRRLASALDGR